MSSRILVDEIYGKTSGGSALTIDSNNYVIAANKPYVLADMSQTSGTNAYVTVSGDAAIPFGTVVEGDSSLLNTSTYKFQCPVDGIYALAYCTHSNATGSSHYVMRNTDILSTQYESDAGTLDHTAIVRCSAGDELWLKQYSGGKAYYNGGGANVTNANRYTFASFSLIG